MSSNSGRAPSQILSVDWGMRGRLWIQIWISSQTCSLNTFEGYDYRALSQVSHMLIHWSSFGPRGDSSLWLRLDPHTGIHAHILPIPSQFHTVNFNLVTVVSNQIFHHTSTKIVFNYWHRHDKSEMNVNCNEKLNWSDFQS